MFKGISAFDCAACETPFSMNITLLQEPTKEEWKKLYNIINKRTNLCGVCLEAIDG